MYPDIRYIRVYNIYDKNVEPFHYIHSLLRWDPYFDKFLYKCKFHCCPGSETFRVKGEAGKEKKLVEGAGRNTSEDV